ncbi:ribosome biogenesis GTPase Der [bacterium]|nr:ribosome biogenesis GTPase Der [bacterium]MBU1984020.1 ribosome biogenesis GTPase Der [bacterium]
MPLIAIVGRPNVGKSTLFNRVTRSRKAITAPEPGVTRDRHMSEAEWQGRAFLMMDTGGWVPHSEDLFETAIREQVQFALEECDFVLFIGDAHTGPTDVDLSIARLLQRGDKPVVLAVNKTDGPKQDLETGEFYAMGLGDPLPVSAVSGRGVAELLDYVVERLPEQGAAEELSRPRPLVAVVGRPNVGKSSFVNAVVGKPQRVVTEIAGTTRDAADTVVGYYRQQLTLIDTAGLRRRSRIGEAVEFYTTVRTDRALRDCDVAVVLTDAERGVVGQDIRILQQAEELGKGMLLCVNKWDLVEKDARTADKLHREIRERYASLSYVPVMFISCLEQQRVFKVLEQVIRIHEERQKRISTPELNRFVGDLMETAPPPSVKGRDIRFHYVTQVSAEPPQFVFWTGHPDLVAENYQRYLDRRIREQYGFEGVPVRIAFRKKT